MRDSELASNEIQRRIKQYQDALTGKIKEPSSSAKPYQFLTSIGGKDTTQHGMTLRHGTGAI